MKTKRMTNAILTGVLAATVLLYTSCGTLLYPERRGQTSGRIDPGVAVLDGIGLVLFIIPGLIAFAVDFTTGAIYLPPDDKLSVGCTPGDVAEMVAIQVDKEQLTKPGIEMLVKEHTGKTISLSDPGLVVTRIDEGGVQTHRGRTPPVSGCQLRQP
jgi:hypothetical protein